METLIEKLKAEDAKYLRISRNFRVLYWIMIILYSALFLINPDKELHLTDRVSGLCYVLTFTAFLILFRKFYKELKSVDYHAPTVLMLKNAVKRYRLFRPRQAFALIPLLTLDIGLTLSFIDRLGDHPLMHRILLVQAFYIPVMGIAFLIGVWTWYAKYKPLRDKALELLKDLEG